MAKELLTTLGGMEYDGLITDTQPRPFVRGVILDGSEQKTFKRGTLLTVADEMEDDKRKPAESGLDGAQPDCILADDVTVGAEDSAGVAVAAYFSGCFDPDKILDKDGAKIELDAKALNTLRMKGILTKATLHVLNAKED